MSLASRDDLRRSYADAWRKHQARLPLAPLEALIADVIALHPEYQRMLAHADAAIGFEPSAAESHNPFLHMGLHIAIREQVSIDRPPGVRAVHAELSAHRGPHEAEHVMMEALGQTLWQAQRDGRAPDEQAYLALVRRSVQG
jgi:hypothetical protein